MSAQFLVTNDVTLEDIHRWVSDQGGRAIIISGPSFAGAPRHRYIRIFQPGPNDPDSEIRIMDGHNITMSLEYDVTARPPFRTTLPPLPDEGTE